MRYANQAVNEAQTDDARAEDGRNRIEGKKMEAEESS
jgi:hypothetical protein